MRYILRLLTVFVLLALNALPVSALSYGLYVCGQQVVGNDSTFNVTEDGKIKYDPSTRTLTLRNVVIRDSVCAIHNARIDGLTILLEGTDSIFITGADALLLERRTVIRSATHDGLLCISTSKAKGATTSDDAAVRVSGGSTLSITDCYVKISSDGYALKSIKADSLSITAAEVTAQTKVAHRSCIDGFRGVSFTAVNASSNEIWNTKTRTLCTPLDSLPVQSALIQGNLYVGRTIVDVSQTAKEQTITCTGLKRGTLKYDGFLQRLTMTNATLHVDDIYAIRNTAVKFFSIFVQGSDTISSTGSDVMSMLCSTIIEGAGQFSSRLMVKGTGSGIYQSGQPFGYSLTIRDVNLQVEAAVEGLHGQAGYSQLVFNNARVRVYDAAGKSGFKAITAFAGCKMINADTANGTMWRKATGSFDRNDGTTAREVIVDVPTIYYPVIINGHALNNVNSAEIAIEGIAGGGLAYYDHDFRTLYMVNIAFTYPDGVGISSSEPGLTIQVNGTNAVTAHYGLQVEGPARITGPGTLNIIATHTAITVNTSDTFTVDCGVLTARGANSGYVCQGSGTLKLAAAQGQAETTHIFGGIHGNIKTAELELSEMNISSPVCCYFDPETSSFKQNGGKTVTDELMFQKITKRYGVKIMGVEIDNCNVKGVGSPYIDSRKFMSFDEDTKTLTLKDFNVETEERIQIINSTCDGLRIRLEGESTLSTAAGAAIMISNPDSVGRVETVFCGDGKLNLKAHSFAVLIGARSGVTFTDHVVVKGDGAIGGNNFGKMEESLTIAENAYVTCTGSFNYPAVEQLASITFLDKSCIVKPNHGKVEEVNFGHCVADRWGDPAHEVIMGQPESMGLFIGEETVTTANYTDVFADGQFCYDPESRTLTVTNANLEATTGVRAAGIDNQWIDGLNIVIVGDNTINVHNSVIRSEKFFIITGDGTLNGTSTGGIALRLFRADCNISGPTLNLKGNTYAVRGDNQREILRVMNSNTQLKLKTEGRATLSGLGALYLGAGLHVTRPAQAMFDTDFGGITVNGELYNGTVLISNREPSAITMPEASASGLTTAVYDFSGRKIVNSPWPPKLGGWGSEQNSQIVKSPKGFHILRMADGTVRKQIVK